MMIRRILLASAGALALAGTALAADLRPPPPPVFVPPPSWTGFYAGLNAGGTWSGVNNGSTATANLDPFSGLIGDAIYNSTSAALATTNTPLHPTAGFIGGGQIGYNYQFYNSFLAGVEADIQGTSSDFRAQGVFSQAAVPGFAGFPISQDIASSQSVDWLGTVRGRLGYLFTPTLLVYGTGGFAYGQTNSTTSITQFVSNAPALPNSYGTFGRFSNTRTGWTAGGGLEWMFFPNWSFKVEYLYYNLGSAHYSDGVLSNFNSGGVLFTQGLPVSKASFNGNIVRVGVNYHFFTWPPVVAPVVAKY
jgi:outer membrane immunogenic protein